MDFQQLFCRVSPMLKRIARSHKKWVSIADENDLYQEMCIHLYNNFKDGVPADINEAYIIKGCQFHILNYLRKQRQKVGLVSLDEPINENGDTLEEILPWGKEDLSESIDKELTIEEIKSNGFSKRQKQVFVLLLQGYTVREVGRKLGISHVMVVKLKKKIIKKWREKDKNEVTKE